MFHEQLRVPFRKLASIFRYQGIQTVTRCRVHFRVTTCRVSVQRVI